MKKTEKKGLSRVEANALRIVAGQTSTTPPPSAPTKVLSVSSSNMDAVINLIR